MATYYEILNVSPTAEDVVIESAYKALLRRYHPDVAKLAPAEAERRTKEITEAFDTLKDPQARARYDRELAAPSDHGDPEKWDRARPEPSSTTPGPSHRPPSAPGGGLAAALFSGLAVLVLIGALGSLSGPGPTSAAGAAAPAEDPGPEQKMEAEPPRKDAAPVAASAAVGVDANATEPEGTSKPRPSFDCARSDSEVLRLVCEDPGLAEADSRMAVAYREAMAAADDPAGVRAAQRDWMRLRDSATADRTELMGIYEQRLRDLTGGPADEPIT